MSFMAEQGFEPRSPGQLALQEPGAGISASVTIVELCCPLVARIAHSPGEDRARNPNEQRTEREKRSQLEVETVIGSCHPQSTLPTLQLQHSVGLRFPHS